MWELDHKAEHWRTFFWTVVLEKTLESPLDCKEIQLVHPKGNTSWIFIGRTDAEAKTPILWPPDGKNWLTGKDADAGKDWRPGEKGTMRWLDSITHLMDMRFWSSSASWWWTEKPVMLQSMGSERVVHNWATELNDYHSVQDPHDKPGPRQPLLSPQATEGQKNQAQTPCLAFKAFCNLDPTSSKLILH